jgi:uncharacterized membrane protein YdbT with pleckstrin-like domain
MKYPEAIWTDKPHNFFGLSINFTRYALTETTLITSKGLLTRNEDLVALGRIVDVGLSETLFDRMFKVGTVIIHAVDVDTPEKFLSKVKDPRAVVNRLTELSNNAKKNSANSRDIYATAMGFPGGCDN